MKTKKRYSKKRFLFALLAALALVGATVGVAVGGVLDSGGVVMENSEAIPPVAPNKGPYEVDGPGAAQFAVINKDATTTVRPADDDAKPSRNALPVSLAGQGVTGSVPVHVVIVPFYARITVAEVGTEVCLGADRLSTCGSPEDAVKGQVIAGEFCSPELPADSVRLIGLVPDGVGSVQVTKRDGSSEQIAVVSNVFAATVSGVPSHLSWQGEQPITVQAPIPPGYSSEECA